MSKLDMVAYLTMALLGIALALSIDHAVGGNSQISEWSYDLKYWLQERRERKEFRKRMRATIRRNRKINPELWDGDGW